MKAAVTVRFRVADIIFSPDQPDVVLLCQSICQEINIIYIRAYHPDSGNVVQVI